MVWWLPCWISVKNHISKFPLQSIGFTDMKASNLLITLTDMESYSIEENLKLAILMVKKRKKLPKRPISVPKLQQQNIRGGG